MSVASPKIIRRSKPIDTLYGSGLSTEVNSMLDDYFNISHNETALTLPPQGEASSFVTLALGSITPEKTTFDDFMIRILCCQVPIAREVLNSYVNSWLDYDPYLAWYGSRNVLLWSTYLPDDDKVCYSRQEFLTKVAGNYYYDTFFPMRSIR